MKKLHVLVVYGFKEEHLDIIGDFSEKINVYRERARTSEDVAVALDTYPDAEVLYTIHTPQSWSDRWNIRWIQIHYAGSDHVSLDAIPRHVELTTASGVNSVAVAEHALSLIFALRRRLPLVLKLQSQCNWPEPKDRWKAFARPLLRGETIGILGYGSIGREIGRVAKSLGMRVFVYKRNPDQKNDRGFVLPGTGDPDGSIPDAFYGQDDLHAILNESDIIVNVLPSTARTEKILDREAFSAMKTSALFISVGRGKTVDESALIEAIEKGTLSGAGLDVFETEPLRPSSPLWQFDNVIISPHMGGFFSRYDEIAMILFRENLSRYLSGQNLLNRVDRKLGY
ncbi:MAG: D-2-hydroxyacid dehydrogenase [Deltaproteobacteria bacterium]|nr:D-2-hydroxyacid dehydrogenase [Deltaproteobacteria bacterium]